MFRETVRTNNEVEGIYIYLSIYLWNRKKMLRSLNLRCYLMSLHKTTQHIKVICIFNPIVVCSLKRMVLFYVCSFKYPMLISDVNLTFQAGTVLGFYILVSPLLAEADTVTLQRRLVSENLLNKVQKQKCKKLHGKLFELWDKYDNSEITTLQLLRATSKISGLGRYLEKVRAILNLLCPSGILWFCHSVII